MASVDLGAAVDEQGDDHHGNHEEHEPRRPQMTSVEATGAVLARRRVLDTDDGEDHERHQHRRCEEVFNEGEPVALTDQRDVKAALKERTIRFDDRGHQNGKAPHRKEVGQTRNGPAQELALAGYLDNLGFAYLAKALPATRSRLAASNETRQPVETTTGRGKAHGRYGQSNNDPS